MDNDPTYKDLVEKYLLGETSAEEKQELKGLISSDNEVKAYYIETKRVLELVECAQTVSETDSEKAKQIFFDEISKEEPKVIPMKSNPVQLFLKIAAVLVIAVGVGYYFLPSNKAVQVAMVITEPVEINTECTLTDESNISVSAGSIITYPETFGADSRKVLLEGEAYFEIKPDPNKPFTIEAGNSIIKAIGTSFNVNASNKDSVVVTVVEGIVMVYHKLDATEDKSEYQLLHAGEKGTMGPGDDMVVIDENNELNFLSWYDNKLHFKNAQLVDVIDQLNTVWGLQIQLEHEKLNACTLTVNFNDKNIENILEILEFTLGIEADRSEGKVVLTGEGC